MNNKKENNLIFITDDDYVVPTLVAIRSASEHYSSQTKLVVNVVTRGLSEENRALFLQLDCADREIRLVDCSDAATDFHKSNSDGMMVASETALLKFYLPEIFSGLDKALYLDGDILVKKDISPVFEIDLADKYAGVVRDLPQVLYEKRNFGDNVDYFNSGVMLLNLKLLREDGVPLKLVECKRSMTDDTLMDQNVFNKVFASKVEQLDLSFNLSYGLFYLSDNFDYKALSQLYGYDNTSLKELGERAGIVHFSSYMKPWLFFDVPFANEWHEEYKKTPLVNKDLKRVSVKGYTIKEYKRIQKLVFCRKPKGRIFVKRLFLPFVIVFKSVKYLFSNGFVKTMSKIKSKLKRLFNKK